ncbi:sulfur carrier protein ThiS [Lachnospira multipara]|jgi:sulfur carrier protein|uniref:sulfur carrier protein ThiS n=1 Tax=Lachnospira multipara TaxID=28051 RepID=UPI00048414FB|nr:sulfur carrier protein ThiS [Lachnospira multipara]
MVKVNGVNMDVDEQIAFDVVSSLGFKENTYVLELNEEILKKDSYKSTILHSGDVLEVVSFMGGG